MNDDNFDIPAYDDLCNTLGRLLLPPFSPAVRRSSTSFDFDIYDPLRRAWVALTPEEWVRQHFVHYLTDNCGISPFRIANEIALTLNGTALRADTVVYGETLRPAIVVEYKAASVPLTAAVLDQALRYNLVFDAPRIIITNGVDAYTWADGKASRGVILPTP